MTADQQANEWTQRIQSMASAAIERAGESTANFQRLLLAIAAPGVASDHLAAELTRFGQSEALNAYQQIAEVNARTVSRFLQLVSRYQTDYARGLVSPSKVAAIGSPPSPPQPPIQGDTTEWVFWFQRFSAWISDQQLWSSRLYRAIMDEAASGGLGEEAVRSHGTTFVRDRLPDYMAEVAEVSFDSFSDLLAATDESVRSLTDAIMGSAWTNELTVDVEGVAGATVSARLLVENNHPEAATVACVATPAEGFALAVSPKDIQLATGDSQIVTIFVTLPEEVSESAVAAGDVTVAGHDDVDLIVHVAARVNRPDPGVVTVRVLDSDTDETQGPAQEDGPV